MQAIILAAGLGKRLGNLTKEHTKCMVKVNGVCLIDRLLHQLKALHLNRIILVVGYHGERLKEHVGNFVGETPIEFVHNPVYDKTNNIYSLYLARKEFQEDDTLLIESDVIFEDSVFLKLVNHPYPNLAIVDRYEPWMDGTMVQLGEDGDIVNFISKKAFRYDEIDTYYKTVNLYKFSKKFICSHYIPFLEAYCKALGNNEYYEQVLRVITLLDKCELKALPLDKENWYEIDDIQDLDIAETLFAKENQLHLYQKRYGGYWRFPQLKDFCYLVNPYFPPAKMKEELRANFDILLTEYPSGMFVNSLVMAKNFRLKQDYVVVGNGAAELIKGLMESIFGRVGVIFPTFEEYPNRQGDLTIIPFIPGNRDFSYGVSDLIRFFSDKKLDVLVLINPDNPSGNFIPQKDVFVLINWARENAIRLIVDESFVDFSNGSSGNSLLQNEILETYTGLIVVKSISKSYGVPGLRLGIMASSDCNLIVQLRKKVAIWNINSFAEFYLQIYSKYEGEYEYACQRFIEERERFGKELQQIEYLRLIPSQANYFLCEVIGEFTSTELTCLLLERYNILIKDCAGKTAFEGKNYIRIAVRDRNDNSILIKILKQLSK